MICPQAARRPQCAVKWDRNLKPKLAIMPNALPSQTDRQTLTSQHKREMYILHLALKNCTCAVAHNTRADIHLSYSPDSHRIYRNKMLKNRSRLETWAAISTCIPKPAVHLITIWPWPLTSGSMCAGRLPCAIRLPCLVMIAQVVFLLECGHTPTHSHRCHYHPTHALATTSNGNTAMTT